MAHPMDRKPKAQRANPVLSRQQAKALEFRLKQEGPVKIWDPIDVPPALRQDEAWLRAMILKHRTPFYVPLVNGSQNRFLAIFKRNYPRNRKLNEQRSEWWWATTIEGRWGNIGALTFDTDGFLRDGQHRAAAFARAAGEGKGPPVVWIMFGAAPEDCKHFDTGLPRSVAQEIGLEGARYPRTIAAMAHMQYRIEHGGKTPDPAAARQTADALAADDDIVRITHCAAELFRKFRTPPSSGALAYWLISKESRRKLSLDEFHGYLIRGRGKDIPDDSPIWDLSVKLERERDAPKKRRRGRGQYLFQTQQAAWIIKGWNGWVNGEKPNLRAWNQENSLPVIDAKER